MVSSLGIIVILTIVVGLYWNFYLRGPSIEPASIKPEKETVVPEAKKVPRSIAVIPFVNYNTNCQKSTNVLPELFKMDYHFLKKEIILSGPNLRCKI